ncbi:MAG TPA: hypothetical protein PKW42_09090, partial [bacterium]|nr:hypothetical protein [bacterium]
IGVNLIRTHDFYGPLDMAVMYPDRGRDPASKDSYDFSGSDRTWQSIVKGGFEPYFRLGDSWNNVRPPVTPQERSSWVRAAVEVVRHYHCGQWQGYKTDFRFVEIWNEPDHPRFWPRPLTPALYFQLYVETATALKQTFPDLSIGGPGLTQAALFLSHGKKWVHDFLLYVKQGRAPLDFFSWHLYSNHPQDWINGARFYRSELDSLGFTSTALHVTEWHTSTRGLPDRSEEALALRTGGKAAAILTAAWIAMQEMGIAVSTIYRGTDPAMEAPEFYGIFYADGTPKRTALAFSLWARMTKFPEKLRVDCGPEKIIWILAGRNKAGEVALLIANTTAESVSYTITGGPAWPETLLQVSQASDRIQSLPVKEKTISLPAEAVHFLILGRPG